MIIGIFICMSIGIVSLVGCSLLDLPGAASFAIFFGLVFGNISPDTVRQYKQGIAYCEKVFLPISIILMGFAMQLETLKSIGKIGTVSVTTSIFSALLSMILLYILNNKNRVILLLGIGNAICGSSAIAATAQILRSSEEDTGLSMAVVNLLGVFGILIIPAICYALGFTAETSGIMIGSSLQAVGQVSAASFTMGATHGEVATVVKMARILFLGPVIMLFILFLSTEKNKNGSSMFIPGFIIGFFMTFLFGSLFELPLSLLNLISLVEKVLLISAMTAIGCKINLISMIKNSSKTLLWGLGIWLIQLISLTLVLSSMND
jgi:uncharacterized integral membrane protein (TIGR00698 family)